MLPVKSAVGDTSDEEGLPDEVCKHPSKGGIVSRNGYFTLRNDPGYPHARVFIVPRLCVSDELGTTHMSKSLVTAHYDNGDGKPVRTYMALRAWMLMRVCQGGWVDRKASRQKWHALEAEQLRKEVRALGAPGGGTGSLAADAHIRNLWPDAIS